MIAALFIVIILLVITIMTLQTKINSLENEIKYRKNAHDKLKKSLLEKWRK